VGTKEIIHSRIWARDPRVAVEKVPQSKLILPEDQQKTVEIVDSIGRRFSSEIEVVDVAKKNFLRRALWSRFHEVKDFPTLIANTGQKLQGQMTEERVESFLRQIAKSEKKKYF
jgi:hypothetical protein